MTTKLADHDSPARSQHARHFAKRLLRIRQEAEDRDCYDDIKQAVRERQRLRTATNKGRPELGATGAAASRIEHARIVVDANHLGALLGKPGAQQAITASDIEHAFAEHRLDKGNDHFLFNVVGNPPQLT
ncbi:MAG: hypothetical protein ABS35_27625 [Kaistia sp. SCN 65-12]|nr:MAG: hypothetical protein ABS35_27625 [Kaistia sp. SCN 65-12]